MKTITHILTVLAIAISLVMHSDAFAQSPSHERLISAALSADPVFAAWKGNADVQSCGLCHYSPGNEFAVRETDFCCLTELEQWIKSDKHAIARQRIEPIDPAAPRKANEPARSPIKIQRNDSQRNASAESLTDGASESNFLSFAICEKLGYDANDFRENCLTCHAGLYPVEKIADGLPAPTQNQPGISCTYCHQIDGNSAWLDLHGSTQAKSNWRTLPPSVKSAQGMRDLVGADAKANLCFSCHIGDIKKNMFITHRMFAAGHPPLPSVELSKLTDAMPVHWRSPSKLYGSLAKYSKRLEYFAVNYPAQLNVPSSAVSIDQLPWVADTVVSGAIAAQQHSLRLLVDAASTTPTHWGDYALYDCAACHHDLASNARSGSLRQAAREASVPGRPRLFEWPQALAWAAAAASKNSAEYTALNAKLQADVAKRPFGDREAVVRSAREFVDALERWKVGAASQWLSVAFSIELLNEIAQSPDDLLIDYHSARQINWAIRSIDQELHDLEKPLPEEVRVAIAELGAGPDAQRVSVSTILPSGRNELIYPNFLHAELERQAAYDSAKFRQQLNALAELLRALP